MCVSDSVLMKMHILLNQGALHLALSGIFSRACVRYDDFRTQQLESSWFRTRDATFSFCVLGLTGLGLTGQCCEQEMTLDEYEKLMEEKRATLNKALKTPTYKVDTAKEFQGMKVVEKRDIEEDSPFELTNKKQIGARKAGLVEKERKEVFFSHIFFQKCIGL